MGLGPKGASEQPVGMQALQPLAIESIGFRTAGSALGLTRINQEDLHATGFQEFEEGNPVDASGFHGDGGDAAVDEPVGQDVEVGGEGAETAYGLGGAIRGHGHPVLGFADVDAGGVRIEDLLGARARWRLWGRRC